MLLLAQAEKRLGIAGRLAAHIRDERDPTRVRHLLPDILFAVNKATGEEIGRVELPATARYGMMTYMHEGKQHVVIQSDNQLTALRLP